MDHEDDLGSESLGGCHMCLAIPGKITEISADNPDSALRGCGQRPAQSGLRPSTGRDRPQAGRLGAHPRRLCQ